MSVLITDTTDFSPALMFGCGQCFRFTPMEDGVYGGIAYGKEISLTVLPEGVLLDCAEREYETLWHSFFDMELDYAAARKSVAITPFMSEAAEFGRGIRILRQDFWEAACSFIISQCNNIKRIQGIINRLCVCCGGEIAKNKYAFPSAETIAALSADKLRELGMGYRAPYVLTAAKAVASGEITAGKLNSMSYAEALKTLCNVSGIGEKVANCILLYGLHRMDAFPLDVWMKRAMREHFPAGFDPAVFGQYAGIAQQYIFHYVRYLNGVKL